MPTTSKAEIHHPITGLHHVTAIARAARANAELYTETLGLRLVKRTVNFDDPSTYHLYYGDASGSPGSIMTFFPWAGARLGTLGSGQTAATTFAVRGEAIEPWRRRLRKRGLEVGDTEVFGAPVLRFRDGDGLVLELAGVVADGDVRQPWTEAGLGVEQAIRGFDGVTLMLQDAEGTADVLEVMGYQRLDDSGEERGRRRIRYRAAGGESAAHVDLLIDPRCRPGRVAAGSVHHVAFRVRDDAAQAYWRQRLAEHGYWPTEVKDRQYFRSVYFREPGGVLFELATDAPGFAIDEAPSRLGQELRLPAWLERDRDRIEMALPWLGPAFEQAEAGGRDVLAAR
jgi:glyoxalase family protein